VRAERAADVDPPGTQVLCFLIPQYVQDDATLARVIDDRASDRLLANWPARRSATCSRGGPAVDLPVANPDDTVLELAVMMARTYSPRVAVVEQDR
jgi:hypothetical protein